MTDTLFLDSETFSRVPIARGTYRYATRAEVMIVTWARNDGPVRCWDLTAEHDVPADLLEALRDPNVRIVAHNAIFDRTLLARCEWYRALNLPLTRWHCMMHRAYAHGLPGKLEKLSEIFRLGSEGKIEGKVYMQLFTKPQANGQRLTRETHPMEWEGFEVYASQDIVAMRALDRMMPNWNMVAAERALYVLDQTRNDRGFAVDVPLAHAIIKTVTEESKKLADRTSEITDGEVLKATQRNKLLQWLFKEHGVELPDLKADTVERRLDDPELPESVKELLRIRQQASKASTAKAKRIVDSEVGGRMRGAIQIRGAQRTGRDAGRIFQPQNLPRPKHKQNQIDMAIEALKGDYLQMLVDDPIGLASSCLRGLIVAEPGNKLVVADLANIEGRMLAWLAGETWKIQAFRDYDTVIGTDEKGKPIRKGHDLYKLAYARAFGIRPEDVDDHMRQIGKVMELALGYGGGVGAFATMAVTYGVDLEDMAEKAWPAIPADTIAYARSRWQADLAKLKGRLNADGSLMTPFDMAEKTYVVCQSLVTLWRKAHPATVQFWHSLEEAVTLAIATPEHNFPVRNLVVDRRGNWLRIKLPSGRYLCYPSPKLDEKGISYVGVNQYTRQWARIRTYGGKLVENVDQAASADVLKDAELRAEAAGYNVVLPVHDEVVSEPPDDPLYNLPHLCSILSTNSPWNAGLPLAAAGFEGYRYAKK
jgi:DNA polymerase bacteriophage-type